MMKQMKITQLSKKTIGVNPKYIHLYRGHTYKHKTRRYNDEQLTIKNYERDIQNDKEIL